MRTDLAKGLGIILAAVLAFHVVPGNIPSDHPRPLTLTEELEAVDLTPYLGLLAVSGDQVAARLPGDGLAALPLGRRSALLFSKERRWLRLTLDNPTEKTISLVLANPMPLASVWLVAPTFAQGTERRGLREDAGSRLPAFQLAVSPGRHILHLGVDAGLALTVIGFHLWSPQGFREAQDFYGWSLDGAYGASVMLWLYNLVLLPAIVAKGVVPLLVGGLGMIGVDFAIAGLPTWMPPEPWSGFGDTWAAWAALTLAGFSNFQTWFFNGQRRQESSLSRLLRLSSWIYPAGAALFYGEPTVFGELFMALVLAGAFMVVLSHARIGLGVNVRLTLAYLASALPYLIATALMILQSHGAIAYRPWIIPLQVASLALLLLLLSISVGVFSRSESVAKGRLEESLALGRSVQDLLLPRVQSEDLGPYEFRFSYSPDTGNMSGHWAGHWQTPDGSHHFLVGHVAGEGPEAALAVAAIVVSLHRSAGDGRLLGAALEDLSESLHRSFAGRLRSGFAGVTVDKGPQVVICSGGDATLVAFGAGVSPQSLTRGPWLGAHPTLAIRLQEITLRGGDTIIASSRIADAAPCDLQRRASQLIRQDAASLSLQDLDDRLSAPVDSDVGSNDRALLLVRATGRGTVLKALPTPFGHLARKAVARVGILTCLAALGPGAAQGRGEPLVFWGDEEEVSLNAYLEEIPALDGISNPDLVVEAAPGHGRLPFSGNHQHLFSREWRWFRLELENRGTRERGGFLGNTYPVAHARVVPEGRPRAESQSFGALVRGSGSTTLLPAAALVVPRGRSIFYLGVENGGNPTYYDWVWYSPERYCVILRNPNAHSC